MALLKIETFPSEILRKKTKPITDFNDKNLHIIIRDMTETMYKAPGVGLAANQVGLSLQLAIIDVIWKQEDKKRDLQVFIQPQIIEKKDPIDFEEGCLSFPGVTAVLKRFNKVMVKYLNDKGKEQILKAEGLLAIALQHETDHLNGKLYIDHLSPLKKEMLLKRYKKLMAEKNQASRGSSPR